MIEPDFDPLRDLRSAEKRIDHLQQQLLESVQCMNRAAHAIQALHERLTIIENYINETNNTKS